MWRLINRGPAAVAALLVLMRLLLSPEAFTEAAQKNAGTQDFFTFSSPEEIRDCPDYCPALSKEHQMSWRNLTPPGQAERFGKLFAYSGQSPGQAAPAATIDAGSTATLTYSVTARNLSGVPVHNPVIRDNGAILDNNRAVKTGGNGDNTLETGETWTWTYTRTEKGITGHDIRNTATIEGPDDAARDSNPGNNKAQTVVRVVPPQGKYDLSVTKTVSVSPQPVPTGRTDEPVPAEKPGDQDAITRSKVLNKCNEWIRQSSEKRKTTSDIWDISAIPEGTSFDFKFDADTIPDKFIVQYPAGNTIFDSGWIGSQKYFSENPVSKYYPGGLSGPGKVDKNALFVKGASNTFVVNVYGPEGSTNWSYHFRANCK